MFHVIDTEQLLEGHTSDTCNGIQACQGKCGDAHRHKALGSVNWDSEHLQESGNTGGEDSKRSTGCRRAISGSGNAQSQDSQ